MRSTSPIFGTSRVFRSCFFRTALLASIAAALLAAPVFTSAQNPHKPTARVVKPLKNDRDAGEGASTTATAPVRSTHLPRSVPAIPQLLTTISSTSWTALGPAPIPNGQTIPADANGISLTQQPVSGRVTAIDIDPTNPNTVYVG